MRSKGHVYVVAESMYSDRPRIPMNPPHHEGSPLRTSAFSQGGHGTVLYVFGRHCTMVYAPGREYVFMEPRERGCVLFPSSGTPHEYLRRSLIRGGRRERDHRFGIQCVELLRPFRKGGRRPLVLPKYQGKPAMQER